MKRLLSIITIVLLLGQVLIPYGSYAQSEIQNEDTMLDEKEQEEEKKENDENETEEIEKEPNDNTESEIEEENTEDKIEETPQENNEKENLINENNVILEEKPVQIMRNYETVRLEEGIYKIVMATDRKQSLTVDGGRINDGANIHIWEYVGARQQQFEIKYDTEGYCEIIPMHSGKRLDVVGWGNEANVDQWSENGGNDNQKWIIQKSERGNYNIVSKRENRYLDAYQSRTVNGTNIEVYEQSGGNGQEFWLEKIGDKDDIPTKTVEEGTYKIVMATAPNQSLTVDGGRRNNGANVHLWEYLDTMQQQFNLVYDGNGYYEIIPINSGKRLDVVGWGNEANVDQWSNNGGGDNQKWQIKKSRAGNYNIVSKRENRYLDAYQSKTENGINIQVYEKSGGNGQEFKLEKIENRSERTIEERAYKIAPQVNKNIVVEASGSNTDNDGRIQIWKDYNVKAQKLNLEYENGYYKISLGHSKKYLTVKYRNIARGSEIIQYEWNGGENQKWIIRENEDGSIGILPLSNPNLTITIRGSVDNGSILELNQNEKTVNQRFCFIKTNLGVDIDVNRYPGIGEAIDKLVERHENWEFEILYTGLDFYTSVQAEYEFAGKQGNLVYTPTYKGDWIAPNPYVKGEWASASYQGIAYFMDPRNFLNEVDTFQFVDLGNYAGSGATLGSIQYQVNGTFLENYAEDVRRACENTNINPYYIIARLFQEQGRDGSYTIYMDGGDGKQYFNPFNIAAKVGDEFATALARAKSEGWDTMQKGIEGGIRIIKKNYIDIEQNTLYLNKFDVNPASGGGFYNHQYMQNLSAAYSEAHTFRSAYVDTGTLDNQIKFIVPVYENMPETACWRPTGEGETVNNDKGPISVKVVDTEIGLALRTEASTSGTLIERMPTGTILLSVERLSNGWHKVIAPSGNTGYCSNVNLQIIADDTNCNDRVMVVTNAKIGTNVRIGPGMNYETIRAVLENSTGTRIVTNRYTDNQYWWDEVIFDDGTKGFVATDFLRKIN